MDGQTEGKKEGHFWGAEAGGATSCLRVWGTEAGWKRQATGEFSRAEAHPLPSVHTGPLQGGRRLNPAER